MKLRQKSQRHKKSGRRLIIGVMRHLNSQEFFDVMVEEIFTSVSAEILRRADEQSISGE